MFFDIASRPVRVAGITRIQTSWMTQLARNGRESVGYAIAQYMNHYHRVTGNEIIEDLENRLLQPPSPTRVNFTTQ